MIVYDRLWETMKQRNNSQYKLLSAYPLDEHRLGYVPVENFNADRFAHLAEPCSSPPLQ